MVCEPSMIAGGLLPEIFSCAFRIILDFFLASMIALGSEVCGEIALDLIDDLLELFPLDFADLAAGDGCYPSANSES